MARADWRPKERSSVGRLMDGGNWGEFGFEASN
jgi:hypothetical protein